MTFENMFGPDDVTLEKQNLLGRLEREGLTDEVRERVVSWTKEREKRAFISSQEMIRFNFDRAELYESLGEINDMFECLDQALYQTQQEGFSDLEETIKTQIQKMEEKYPA